MSFGSLQCLEVDDEAVAHVALDHALVGVVDVLYWDHLDVGQQFSLCLADPFDAVWRAPGAG